LFNIDPSTIDLKKYRRMSKAEFNRKWAPIIENLKGLCKANRGAGDPEATDVVDAGFNEPVINTDTDESPLTPAFTTGFTTKEDADRDSKASCDSQVPLNEQDEELSPSTAGLTAGFDCRFCRRITERPAAYMTSEGITDRENKNKIDTRIPV
jgi:hypothetical protein